VGSDDFEVRGRTIWARGESEIERLTRRSGAMLEREAKAVSCVARDVCVVIAKCVQIA
jgi:hypothetical protein